MMDRTVLRQLNTIIESLVSMRGRVTMLGISRWSETGGSYRTIQRFFGTTIDWMRLNIQIINIHMSGASGYLLAGDEVVITKSGKKTYGLDRFFSSIQSQVVKSIAFLNVSLIDIDKRKAYTVLTKQIIKEKQEGCSKAPKIAKSIGRPKGSKNINKAAVELSPYLQWVQEAIVALLPIVRRTIPIKYFLFDGEFGSNPAVEMINQTGLKLISKLKSNSALYLPFTGEYSGKGAPKKYGDKLNYAQLPHSLLKKTIIEEKIETKIYQTTVLNRSFAARLNVTIIIKTNMQTHQQARVILFSTDLELDYETMIDYYSLRFQIEFLFRDMKQYWGAEDFMNINQTPLNNAINLSAFMVNISYPLRKHLGDETMSINNLKAHYHGLKYAREVFKLLPEFDDPILIQNVFEQIGSLGAIEPEILVA